MVELRREARLTIKLQDDEPELSPERRVQELLELEIRTLRDRLRHVESALKTAATVLRPYAPPARTIKK
jgi:hypothetical protein